MSPPPAPTASPFISQNRLPPGHTRRSGGSQSSSQAAPPRHFSASSKMLLTRMRAEDEQPNLREATLPTFTSKHRKPDAPTAAANRGNVNNNNHRRANNRSNGSRSNTHHRLPSGPSPPLLRPAASTSTPKNNSPPIPTGPKGGRHSWNGREGSVLIASVQQHGQDWLKVQAELQRDGAPPRACGAIAQRYFRLSRQAVRQQEIAQAASPSPSGAPGTGSASTSATASSSSTPHQQQPNLASLQTASSDLNKARSKQTMVPWTSEEDRILVLAANAAKQHKEIFPLFCKSLPLTTRTASAVETRWNQFLRPEGRRKRNRSRSKTGDSGGNADNGGQRQLGSVASTLSGTEPPHGPAAATPPPLQQATVGEGSDEAIDEAAAAATLSSMTQEAALAEAQQDVDAAFDSFEGADFAQDVIEDDASMTPLQQADVAATTSSQIVNEALIEAPLNAQEDLVNISEDVVAASLHDQSKDAAIAEQAQFPIDAQSEAIVHSQDDSAISIEEPEFLTPPLHQKDDPPAAGPDRSVIDAQDSAPTHPHDPIIDASQNALPTAFPPHESDIATAEPSQEVESTPIRATLREHRDTALTPTHHLTNDSHQVATLPSAPSASAPLLPLYDQATPALNYTINYLPNGFLIRNFPPHHELHIHSPTSCQVIKPERAALPQLERLIQQQQLEQPYAAPFIFRAGSSGFIQALALPPGTERSVELVSLADDDEDGEDQDEGEGGGGEGQARFIESRFDAPDGYCVRFESQLRG